MQTSRVRADPEFRWNHNIHYHRVVLDAVPHGATRALEIGCGEGVLARELRSRVPEVVGIDRDPPSIALARSQGGGVGYVEGDFFTHPFAPASYDLVASVATLHHAEAATGLARMASLVRPGGRLVVIGLARSRLPRDLPWEIAAVAVNRVLARRRNYWEHSAPIAWPPPTTYPELRGITARGLPGARFRRLVLWRYAIVWTAPSATGS